jgi:predicted permease
MWSAHHLGTPDLVEDAAELFAERARAYGMTEARRWYRAQTFAALGRLALSMLRRSRERSREGRSENVLELAWRSFGAGVSAITRSPSFSLSIVVILALGIGANAVMFGVVDRLLLSPPQHVVNADEVRLIYVRRELATGDIQTRQALTYPDYQDLLEVEAFRAVAGYVQSYPEIVGSGGDVHEARVVRAAPSLFPLLDVQPVRGRFFVPDDDRPGAPATAILAYEYWDRMYGTDPGVLGRTLRIGLTTYTIIGVAPAGFTGPELAPVDLWTPLTLMGPGNNETCLQSRGCYWLSAVVRLAESATVEAAEAEATAAHRAGRAELIAQGRYDADAEVLAAPIIAARGPTPAREVQVATWLAGVSLVVMLIACLNVANLLVAKSIRARRELAVRLALGAGRRRLVADVVIESVLLALLGAGAALLLAGLLEGPVHAMLLPNVAFVDGALGGRLLRFTLITTISAGLLAGLFPALQTRRADVTEALKAGARGIAGQRSRTRTALIVGQAALSVLLLVAAGLFVRSLRAAEVIEMGFDPSRVAFLTIEWSEALSEEEHTSLLESVLPRVRRLPGVTAAAFTFTAPFYSTITIGQPRVPGRDSVPNHPDGGPWVNVVGSGYFEAMGLAVLQGRTFEPSDDRNDAPPVAVVTESMSRAYWPAGDAVGSCMIVGRGDNPPCSQVVGVVENHRQDDLVEDEPLFLYFLNRGHPAVAEPPSGLMLGIETDHRAVLEEVRREALTASPQIRFVNVNRLSEFLEPQLRSWRLGAWLFTAFGVLALFVAAWGLFSVLSFDVALRRHELGVRSALGAGVPRLIRLVFRRAAILVGAGLSIGVVAAYASAQLIEPLLPRLGHRPHGLRLRGGYPCPLGLAGRNCTRAKSRSVGPTGGAPHGVTVRAFHLGSVAHWSWSRTHLRRSGRGHAEYSAGRASSVRDACASVARGTSCAPRYWQSTREGVERQPCGRYGASCRISPTTQRVDRIHPCSTSRRDPVRCEPRADQHEDGNAVARRIRGLDRIQERAEQATEPERSNQTDEQAAHNQGSTLP